MRNFERVLALALVLAPLAAKAAGNGYYTDFMYDNYVRDAGRRPVVVLGSMEYAREPERRERSGDDGNIGWFDLNVGLDSLGSYGVAQGGDMLGGLDLDSDSAIGYGVKLGFDIFDKFLGLEVDFEGSSHGGISPSSSQSSGFQTVIPAGGGSSYFDENGDPVSIPAWPETPILQNYSQNLSFFQGGLNLVFNFGGSDSAINPFVGIGGGIARVRLQNKGVVNSLGTETVDEYACSVAGADKTDCMTPPGTWDPGWINTDTANNGSCSAGGWANQTDCEGASETWTADPNTPAVCNVTNPSALGTYATEQVCALDPLGTWDMSGTISTQSVDPYEFPAEEGANVGYYRGTAGVSVRVAPYTNVVVSGSYTKYKDPDFSTMTLKDLTRKMGSVGLRMNF